MKFENFPPLFEEPNKERKDFTVVFFFFSQVPNIGVV